MKTADELFDTDEWIGTLEFEIRNALTPTYRAQCLKQLLEDKRTEHDQEIKQLVDEMIKEAKKDMDSISIGRVLALTEFKNKAGL